MPRSVRETHGVGMVRTPLAVLLRFFLTFPLDFTLRLALQSLWALRVVVQRTLSPVRLEGSDSGFAPRRTT